VPLTISEGELAKITSAEDALLLGIITDEGQVRLQVADSVGTPGHVEWLKREAITGVAAGFSLLVKKGTVSALFVQSRLNPGADARLEQEFVVQLRDLLPLAREFRILGH